VLHSIRWTWLLAAAVLSLGNLFLHKPVSDVCDWLRARWGFGLYDRTALVVIPLVSLLVAFPVLVRRERHLLARPSLSLSLLALLVITLAAQRWLLVVNIELIHFPQFALLAVLLLAGGLSGPGAYLATAVAGILDETYQHFVVYAGVPGTYFDINDIVLNATGGAWGVVLFAGVLRRGRPGPTRRGAAEPPKGAQWLTASRAAMVALLALPPALWLDPPTFSPLLRFTDSGRALFRVLSTAEGLVVCVFLWALVTWQASDDVVGR